MFQQTKSTVEGADLIHMLSRVEDKLVNFNKKKEEFKTNMKPLEDAEKKVKGIIQANKLNAKLREDDKDRVQKIKDKEQRFKTAQDKMLKGKERMKATRLVQGKKKKKETKKTEDDSLDAKYFETQ